MSTEKNMILLEKGQEDIDAKKQQQQQQREQQKK